MLGFTCLLRTGELLAVQPCDFILGDEVGIVSLQTSKSSVRHNIRESVTIHDALTLEMCRILLSDRKRREHPQVPLWRHSGQGFRYRFNILLGKLHLQGFQFRPYSLRRGGATAEFQSHGLMERTLIRGRWKNSNVARLYISDAVSYLPKLKMSNASRAAISF